MAIINGAGGQRRPDRRGRGRHDQRSCRLRHAGRRRRQRRAERRRDKDFQYGGEGDDRLFGGDGDDLLNGDAGSDPWSAASAARDRGSNGFDLVSYYENAAAAVSGEPRVRRRNSRAELGNSCGELEGLKGSASTTASSARGHRLPLRPRRQRPCVRWRRGRFAVRRGRRRRAEQRRGQRLAVWRGRRDVLDGGASCGIASSEYACRRRDRATWRSAAARAARRPAIPYWVSGAARVGVQRRPHRLERRATSSPASAAATSSPAGRAATT